MTRRLIKPAVIAALCLVLIEGALRWGAGLGDPPLVVRDPDVEYRLVPSQSYRRFGNLIAINSLGMRGPEPTEPPPPNERRILVIGDSVVYGDHFLDQTETIGARLHEALARSPRLAGCRILVLPAAASSWGPVNEAAFLRRTGPLNAAVAVTMVSRHDLYDVPDFREDVIPYRMRPSWSAMDDAWQTITERMNRSGGTDATPVPSEDREAASLSALDGIDASLRGAGARTLLVYHPTIAERGEPPTRERAAFAQWAQARDVRFADLGSVPLKQDSYRDDIHPNAAGAARIATWLARLIESDFPPCR